MSDKLSLPPITNKVSNSYLAMQQKRSRGSWWDPKTDKYAQIQKVKDMVRHSANEYSIEFGNAYIAPAAEVLDRRVESAVESNEILPTPPALPLNRKKASSDTPKSQFLTLKGSGRSVGLQTSQQHQMMPAETQTDSYKSYIKLQESLESYKNVVSRQNSRLKRLERFSMVS